MAESALATLTPKLLAIDPDDIDSPGIPVANAAQEGYDLYRLCQQPEIREPLLAVGVSSDQLEELPVAVQALREAEAEWSLARDPRKSDAQRKLEARAAALRAELTAACRWSLRGNRAAQAALSAIAEGQSLADLVQDLMELATLIDTHRAAFEADRSFDAGAQAEAARRLSSELQTGLSKHRLPQDQTAVRHLRDAAYTYLDDLVATIREAGRYACRRDVPVRRRFASQYRRRHRRRQTPDDAVPIPPTED